MEKHLKTALPITTPVGIIGGGFAALMVYSVLRFRGMPARDIAIFAPDSSPEKSWSNLAHAINQQTMRSESIGHFLPTDSPGLATLEALKNWSPKPIILSWFDQYRPTVTTIIEHARSLAQQLHFWQGLYPARIARIIKEPEAFQLFNDRRELIGRVRHLIIAIGHGRPAVPEAVQRFHESYPADQRVVSAFSEKNYRLGETTLVVGDGLTAATEWFTILERGGSVIAVSRRGFKFGQALNTPREYMSKRGIAPYRTVEGEQRVTMLQDVTRGTIPAYPAWRRRMRRALKQGRLELLEGELTALELTGDGRLQAVVKHADGHRKLLPTNQVIYATGFMPVTTHPLISQLITDYHLPTHGPFLQVANNFQIAQLSSPLSSASVIGPAAAWAIPSADSLMGMKITARKITESLLGAESWRPRELAYKTARWFTLVSGKEII